MMKVNFYLLFWGSIIMLSAIILNFSNLKENKKIRIWVILFQFSCVVVSTSTLIWYYDNIARPAVNTAWFYRQDFALVRNELLEYAAKNNNILPDANTWCDTLLTNCRNQTTLRSALGQRDTNSIVIGFNRSLSGMHIKDIDGKSVLFFQAQGSGNLNGGKVLMDRSSRYPHVYIMFFDGTFGDYNISDNSLRFLEFGLHQSDYLPLKWTLVKIL